VTTRYECVFINRFAPRPCTTRVSVPGTAAELQMAGGHCVPQQPRIHVKSQCRHILVSQYTCSGTVTGTGAASFRQILLFYRKKRCVGLVSITGEQVFEQRRPPVNGRRTGPLSPLPGGSGRSWPRRSIGGWLQYRSHYGYEATAPFLSIEEGKICRKKPLQSPYRPERSFEKGKI